jgi:hypothetical protein
LREEFSGYDYLEDALVRIFDELPNMKTSSVVHKPGVGSGIQIGSRDIRIASLDEFIEIVKVATAKLRLKSKIHYKVIYEWYRANEHEYKGDFGTGLGATKFHIIRKEALEQLSSLLGNQDNDAGESRLTGDEEEIIVLEPGDKLIITGGAESLIGQLAYFDKFLDDFEDRLICNYYVGENRLNCIINLSEVRSLN